MAFANNLAALLEPLGWVPEQRALQLAAEMGRAGSVVDPRSVQRWLDGDTEPRLETLVALTGTLSLLLGYVITSDDLLVRSAEPIVT